jgi:hypothetical protein
MVLSPIVAAIALLVTSVAQWGAFKYLPAAVWFLIFAQCLYAFRWRGLWFLLGAPIAALAIVTYLVAAPPVPKVAQPVPRLAGHSFQQGRLVVDGGSLLRATEPDLLI